MLLQAAIVERACAQPASYVLKPQREGGGNNFYGDGACFVMCGVGAVELPSNLTRLC